jgi:hypothetical protein
MDVTYRRPPPSWPSWLTGSYHARSAACPGAGIATSATLLKEAWPGRADRNAVRPSCT